MRRLMTLALVLPLLAMQAPSDPPDSPHSLLLVPVTAPDLMVSGVALAELPAVFVSPSLVGQVRGLAPATRVVPVADPISRVRAEGGIALVPPELVTPAVKTLELDGRFFWREADRRDWPLRVGDAQAAVSGTWQTVTAGEIIFGRGVQERIERRHQGDARGAFSQVRDVLRGADLTIATLEAPLSGEGNRWCDSCMRFVGNESYAAALVDAGLDLVSLAANHIGDAGPDGVLDTMRALDAVGVRHVGAGATADDALAPARLTVAGMRVAFLAYNDVPPASYGATATKPGSALLTHDDPAYRELRGQIAAAREGADVVFVLAHWGIEYEDEPRANVVAAAHAMVDAGASVVVGDHPHWVQSVERYAGAYIAYGVGNFVFDQMWSQETRQGTVQELWFWSHRLVSVRVRPTIIDDYYRPRLLRPDEPAYRKVFEQMWRHSIL